MGDDSWAEWSTAASALPWTVGIEEELVLLDPERWTVANRIDDVLAALPPDTRAHASPETHACVIELRTAPHVIVADAAAELAQLRRSLDHAVRETLMLRAAAAGTHPLATDAEVAVSSFPRYREIAETMRVLAHREPTMAQHVHVAVPDGAAAVRALNGLRRELPVLLALSANSPYWRGNDTGFASARTPIFSMFPRVGIPRHFGDYHEYVRSVGPLLRSGAIPDVGFLWWDARLQPRLGTVEVRIMDAQTLVSDAAALAALVQCMVRRHAEANADAAGEEMLAENRFLAARDGMRARLIDDRTGQPRPANDALAELLGECWRVAVVLGCTEELGDAAALATDPGDARQRAYAERNGLTELLRRLADEFTARDRSPVPA